MFTFTQYCEKRYIWYFRLNHSHLSRQEIDAEQWLELEQCNEASFVPSMQFMLARTHLTKHESWDSCYYVVIWPILLKR